MIKKEKQMGVFYAAFSYFLWGILPIYWKLLGHVKAHEILANRVFWSFVFMLAVLLVTNKWNAFTATVYALSANKKQFLALGTASLLISVNWFLYIWAVNNGQMIETSLGYYINPLVSVLLGMIVLKERLTIAQYFSFFLALIGVLIMTLSYGRFPWIALMLAVTFGLYGLAKKLIKVDSAIGLTLETMAVTPLALVYIGILFIQGESSLLNGSLPTDLLLIGAGAATAIPLLYFAKGAQKIQLSMLGFIQYIAPTITLILGIFVYGEQFTKLHLLSFTFIWAALTIYSLSRTKLATALELRLKRGKGMEI
ncbi:RarD protein, DMT superfamily transporter [Bacillus methanolicus PB1]|uniref:RarD protein, DMT superfamily transporter n=1 Tax=Bacillus methanolicus PB1 TaxID=997296 RepID=I3DYF5_BACMT|nr:EamA family transporter RarD [Bacillus methanolicus]EIJ79276.1 RarD protein, DMT superfamily transporter [Bacillus methanolicus PB1]